MSEKSQPPSEKMLEGKSSRRTLLKRALMVLGASAIVQVSGGVLAQETPKLETPKKEGSFKTETAKTTHKGSKTHNWNKTTTHKTTDKSSTFKQDIGKAPFKSTTPASKTTEKPQ